MALTTYEEIKRQLTEDYDRENLNEDVVYEIADNNVPVYYADTIEEWQLLPGEYSDTWQGLQEINGDTTITSLMNVDLYNYYLELTEKAYAEITGEAN
jgi:hypothetical protein